MYAASASSFSNFNARSTTDFGGLAEMGRQTSTMSPHGTTAQFVEPAATCVFSHPVSLTASAATPSGVVLIAGGGNAVSAVSVVGGRSSTSNPGFATDSVSAQASIPLRGAISALTVRALSGRDAAIGIAGTCNGFITVFSVSCEDSGAAPTIVKLKDVAMASMATDIASGDPVVSVAVGLDRLEQQEFFAVATPNAVAMLDVSNDVSLLHLTTYSTASVSQIFAPEATVAAGQIALVVVLDTQAVQHIARGDEEGSTVYFAAAPLAFQPSADSSNFVNDAHLFVPDGNACSFGISMCGLNWWGIASSPPSGAGSLSVRQLPTQNRLSLIRYVNDELVVFVAGTDVLVGSANGSRPMRLHYSCSSVVQSVSGLPLSQTSAAAGPAAGPTFATQSIPGAFVAGVGKTAMLFC